MKKKKHVSMISEEKKNNMAESLCLPKDLVMGAAILTATGNTDLYVENYKGIIEYTEERILLQTKTCQIEICGTKLSIAYYTNEDMKICGCFQRISWR